MNGREECADLYRVVKISLVLSHGNAATERGFSVNKQILQDNMMERSLIAQRLVHQAIPKTEKKLLDIAITKQMVADVRMASSRRVAYLEAKREEQSEKQAAIELKKRKASAIRELEAKKKKVNQEASEALRSIDQELIALRR